MSIILSIDPGIRGTGVGLFSRSELVASNWVKNPETSGQGPWQCWTMSKHVLSWLQTYWDRKLNELVLEWPQVYPTSKGDPNDLFGLAGVGAALTALLMAEGHPIKVTYYKPREWKGQLEKDVMGDRVKGRLSSLELSQVPDFGGLTHNILDAIGIGLHHIGRLQPKKVFPR